MRAKRRAPPEERQRPDALTTAPHCQQCGGLIARPIVRGRPIAEDKWLRKRFCRKRCADEWCVATRYTAPPPPQALRAPPFARILECRRCRAPAAQLRHDDYGKTCRLCGEFMLARDADWSYMHSHYVVTREAL